MSRFTDLYGKKGAAEEHEDADTDPNLYTGYDSNRNGRPVMGFYVAQMDGTLHGFMYHHINHPKFEVRDEEEFLSFTSSGQAVVMTGTGLQRIFEALMNHTLKAIHEYDGRRVVKDGAAVVRRLSVTQAVPVRATGGPELVKPAKQAS
jgi:hypothetical protein